MTLLTVLTFYAKQSQFYGYSNARKLGYDKTLRTKIAALPYVKTKPNKPNQTPFQTQKTAYYRIFLLVFEAKPDLLKCKGRRVEL